ncbi:hypothetical protein [Saccharopolyspora shandongensis]|uniref:hypothetical protein n=1 Tax=Saccharopolyspora shandongensis TaxID=418495 RepID=UPI00340E5ACE
MISNRQSCGLLIRRIRVDGRNQCVDQWLDGYLTDLKLPPADTVCAAERGPFDPPSASR